MSDRPWSGEGDGLEEGPTAWPPPRPDTDPRPPVDDVLSPYRRPVYVLPATGALPPPRPRAPRPRWGLAVALFLATVVSTTLVGSFFSGLRLGLVYSGAVMLILLSHELGHFFQARRHRVPVSPPYFIPFPLSAFGTLGAVILMPARLGDRRKLFDVAITGPLAGLVPTLVACVWGLHLSTRAPEGGPGLQLGEPLLFRLLATWVHGDLPDGVTLVLHPLAYAGWVGLLITALNLVPIGQLDGGHILYALLRRRAHGVATVLMAAIVVATVVARAWAWTLMILLVILTGVRHPPTADDAAPLGRFRVVLGWVTLLFLIVGFTPQPFIL